MKELRAGEREIGTAKRGSCKTVHPQCVQLVQFYKRPRDQRDRMKASPMHITGLSTQSLTFELSESHSNAHSFAHSEKIHNRTVCT